MEQACEEFLYRVFSVWLLPVPMLKVSPRALRLGAVQASRLAETTLRIEWGVAALGAGSEDRGYVAGEHIGDEPCDDSGVGRVLQQLCLGPKTLK